MPRRCQGIAIPLLACVFAFVSLPLPSVLAEAPLLPEREVVQQGGVIPDWKRRWDEARDQVRRGRLPVAVRLYEELLAGEPQLHEARWELARIWLRLGEREKALHHFELLREARPENPEYAEGLAAVLLAGGRFGRAAELYAGLLSKNPERPSLLAGLVAAQLGQGRGERALPHLERLVALVPNHPGFGGELAPGASAQESLARLYLLQGMGDRARPLVRRLAEPANASPELLILAADIHEDLGQRRQAAVYWRRLLAGGAAYPRAVARLEDYQLTEGQGEEALALLLSRLAAAPDDSVLLRRTAQVYLGMTRFGEALPHLERYLELNPTDRESLLLLLDLYNTLQKRAEALVVFERLQALKGETAPDKLIQAARLYEEQGEKLRALALYRRILEGQPGDPALIARKLRLLDQLGRENEIREIMEQPEYRSRTTEILAAWHEIAPENREVAVALAWQYLEQGRLEESEELLVSLGMAAATEPEFLRVRALLHEQRQRPHAAWRDYEQLLRLEPDRPEIRRRALALAAELGLPDRVAEHRLRLGVVDGAGLLPALGLAAALTDVMDPGGAVTALRALSSLALSPEEKVRFRLELARVFRRAGLSPEAEQELRLALLQGVRPVEVYSALFALTLKDGRPAEAQSWLQAIERRLGDYPNAVVAIGDRQLTGAEKQTLVEFLQVRLWLAQGENRQALRLLRRLVARGAAGVERLLTAAVGALLAADSLWQAESLLQEELLSRPSPDPEALVMAARISESRGRGAARDAFLARAGEWAAADPGRALELAEALARHGFHREVPAAVAVSAVALPTSVRGGLLVADALVADGRFADALAQLDRLLGIHPDLYPVQSRRVRVLLALGRAEEVVELSERLAAANPWSSADLVLVRVHALWMQRQWRAALRELEANLAPPVNALFAAAAVEAQLPVPPDQPPGFWRSLTGTVNPLDAYIANAMTPEFAASVQPGDQEVHGLAAPLYARYRRQQRFAMELRARELVERRDFFAATRAFERLVQAYPDQGPLLYDLAGLYSRLGRLELEAALYRQLADQQVEYPRLADARIRNELKRRPRTTLAQEYRREEGRDGYKAMIRQIWTASHWSAPYLGHEVDLAVSRLQYRDPDTDSKSSGRQAELHYRRDAFAGVGFLFGVGAWDLDHEGKSNLLGRAEIAGDFADRFRGRLAYRSEMVEDTITSVRRGIRSDSYSAEAAVDLLPRLEAGAGYGYRYYSDSNLTRGYDLWAAYTVFTDPNLLKVRYSYDFQDSSHGESAGNATASSHPYWTPFDYWRKTFEVFYRHQLTDDPFLRDIPRYYTLRYATIYDSEGYAHQELAGSFFLELSPSLILQADWGVSSATRYRSSRLSTAVTYRW